MKDGAGNKKNDKNRALVSTLWSHTSHAVNSRNVNGSTSLRSRALMGHGSRGQNSSFMQLRGKGLPAGRCRPF